MSFFSFLAQRKLTIILAAVLTWLIAVIVDKTGFGAFDNQAVYVFIFLVLAVPIYFIEGLFLKGNKPDAKTPAPPPGPGAAPGAGA